MENIIKVFMSRGMSRKVAEQKVAILTEEFNEIVAEVMDPEEAHSELVSLFKRFDLSVDYADDLAMG